jgi:hypothetical protein
MKVWPEKASDEGLAREGCDEGLAERGCDKDLTEGGCDEGLAIEGPLALMLLALYRQAEIYK